MTAFNRTAGVVEVQLMLSGMNAPKLNDSQAGAVVDKVLSMIPKPESKSTMDMVMALIANNSGDVVDLINKIGGLPKFFEILPDLIKISDSLKA